VKDSLYDSEIFEYVNAVVSRAKKNTALGNRKNNSATDEVNMPNPVISTNENGNRSLYDEFENAVKEIRKACMHSTEDDEEVNDEESTSESLLQQNIAKMELANPGK
jgi:hypothetical protein